MLEALFTSPTYWAVMLSVPTGRPRPGAFGRAVCSRLGAPSVEGHERRHSRQVPAEGPNLNRTFTALYYSPEQCLDGERVDALTDVWAVGVLIFNCLTGAFPFGRTGQRFAKLARSPCRAPRRSFCQQILYSTPCILRLDTECLRVDFSTTNVIEMTLKRKVVIIDITPERPNSSFRPCCSCVPVHGFLAQLSESG